MTDVPLFVVFVEGDEKTAPAGRLYRLQAIASDTLNPWMINSRPDPPTRRKLMSLFPDTPEDKLVAFSMFRGGDVPMFALDKNTQSVFLGLYLEAYRRIHSRNFRNRWSSVTVSGDIYAHDGQVELKAVGDIEAKYRAAAAHAEKNTEDGKKHLFVYVSGAVTEDRLRACGTADNLDIKRFTSADSPGEIPAFLFEPYLDADRLRLFSHAGESVNRSSLNYAPPPAFRELCREASADSWQGYLVHGEGETGKSRLALELAHYLAERDYIYAPVWIKLDNRQFIETVRREKEEQRERPLLRTIYDKTPPAIPGAAYLAGYIAGRIGAEPGTAEDRFNPLRQALAKRRYLIVIDNLELQRVDMVIDAVKSIIDFAKTPVLLTSRLAENTPGTALQSGLKPVQPSALDKEAVETLVRNIAREQGCEEKLACDDYEAFITRLYACFASFPGMIIQIIPLLADMTVHELQSIMLSLGEKNIRQKARAIYKTIFLKMKPFTRAVLFAFMNNNNPDDKAAEPAKTPKKDGASMQELMIRNMAEAGIPGGWFPENWEFEKTAAVGRELRNLDHRHIIYQTPGTEGARETAYGMKSFTYIGFMFDDALSGGELPAGGRSLRDSLLSPKTIVSAGITYNQPVKLLIPALERLNAKKDAASLDDLFLMAVTESENPAYIEALLKYGCDINRRYGERDNVTPLHVAAGNNQNPDVIRFLLERGADIHAKNSHGCPPFHGAVFNNQNTDIIKLLLDHGADINAVSDGGAVSIHYAAGNNQNTDVIKLLLDRGADINAKTVDNITPLHEAARDNKNPKIIKLLLEYGADINAKANGDVTPLQMAALDNQNSEIIKVLLENGADINAKDIEGATPIHTAASDNQNPEVIKTLLEYGANIHVKNNNGGSPFLYAACNNQNPEVFKFLFEHGMDIHDKDNNGSTLLHYAAGFNGNPEVIKLLLERSANIHAKNNEGTTPLHVAAQNNKNFDIIKLLLDHGADIHDKDNDGLTLLHYAVSLNQNPEIIKFLLEYGTDIHAKTNTGVTPIHYAASENQNPEVIKTLLDRGADIHAKDNGGGTPLHYAASAGQNPEIIKLLLDHGADIHARDNDDMTPLYWAARDNPDIRVILTLLQNGARTEDKDNTGKTALQYLMEREDWPAIRAALKKVPSLTMKR